MRLRLPLLAAFIAIFVALSAHAQPAQKSDWLFAYFRNPGTQGIYLAISSDGYHFTPLNHDQPWVKPQLPGGIMRDVYLTQGPDHIFRMVWTCGWHGHSLGYSQSSDLIHWSQQRKIPLMQNFPEARNVWAPETYWDAAKGKWIIVWSSAVDNIGFGNRIYYSLTKNFHHFTIPALLFDPGYVVIDATIYHGTGKYYLVYKDQNTHPLRYQVRYATGPSYTGPWSKSSEPITPMWSEGPSVVHVGKQYIVYYDHYRVPLRYEGVESTDWIHWKSINKKMALPPFSKHGSFLRISAAEAARLMAYKPPAQ